MISEQQQEQASSYAIGAMPNGEAAAFEAELRTNAELQALVRSLSSTASMLALAQPRKTPPPALRDRILGAVGSRPKAPTPAAEGFRFVEARDSGGWKQLPIPGAWIKLLSLERERGYAVLLGKLDAGVRYPAHRNAGPENFCILTGDLHIGSRRLGPGDFHHADAGTEHEVNYSEAGCTLVAVLTTDDPLVAFAMS